MPQALEGVAAVALLYAAVKRWFGTGAGLAAGALLAATPVAALMFRFNNPDALLVLLLVAGAYCLTRALERGGTRWVVAAGTMIGFAFLAKMMQAFLVLPAFALVYLVAAPTGLRRRVAADAGRRRGDRGQRRLVGGDRRAVARRLAADDRRLVDNSILNLITGYNGLGRIFGSGGPGGRRWRWRRRELQRRHRRAAPVQLPDGRPGVVAAAGRAARARRGAASRRAGRRAPTARAPRCCCGAAGWSSAASCSASAAASSTPTTRSRWPRRSRRWWRSAARMLWARRDTARARLAAAVAVAVSAGWAWVLLDRTPSWEPWLRTAIRRWARRCPWPRLLALRGVAAAATRRLAVAAVVLGVMASLAGPVAYAAQTITTAHTGSVPSAGPASAERDGRRLRRRRAAGRHARRRRRRTDGCAGRGARAVRPARALGGASGPCPRRRARRRMPGGQTTVSAALKQALTADAGRTAGWRRRRARSRRRRWSWRPAASR